MTDAMERLAPAELRSRREYLGLTTEWLASLLDVRHDTVRRWESGHDAIPYRIGDELTEIEAMTSREVDALTASITEHSITSVTVPVTDAQLHEARPDLDRYPARWYRHVAVRSIATLEDVTITAQPR